MSDQPVTSVKRLRETVALGVQATSLHTVALRVGMSPAALEAFLAGEAPAPREHQQLQEWAAREAAEHHGSLGAAEVERAIGALVRDLPPEHRVTAIRRVVASLRHVYREQDAPAPGWLAGLAERWAVTDGDDD